MRFFDRKKVRLLFGFTIFLILLILNCVMYCNKAGMKRDLTVVIDVGHGGNDPGKIGVDNVKEKDVNLQIALCLKAQLQARGVKVILTREGDVCLATNGATNKKVSDMHNRVSLINASGADYMISIHQNSYPEAEISGPQVFYYGSSEMSKKLAEAVQAQLENTKQQMEAAKQELAKPFVQEAELKTKSARLAELDAELNMEKGVQQDEKDRQEQPLKARLAASCPQPHRERVCAGMER